MKQILLSTLLVFIACSSFAQINWNNTSFVHRDSQNIKDGQGNIIKLEGPNLGGWLMWEGWIWNGNFTQQKTIYNSIESELGTATANNFEDSIYYNYITRKDIEQIAASHIIAKKSSFQSSYFKPI